MALRALTDLDEGGTTAVDRTSDRDLLAAALERVMRTRHPKIMRSDQAPGDPKPSPQQRWAFLDSDALDRACRGAARYALNEWRSGYRQRQARRGKVGGERSRRSSVWGWEDLDQVQHLLDRGARWADVMEVLRAAGWSKGTAETIITIGRLLGPLGLLEDSRSIEMDALSRWR